LSRLSFQTDVLSDKGGRKQNEDCVDFLLLDNHACWVVADGLGGHGGGAVAARLAVESVLQSFRAVPECSPDALNRYINAANALINDRRRSDAGLSQMRTTVAVLVSDYRGALWAHIGDSRLYYLKQDRIRFQTQDHSVPQVLCNAGEITPTQIRFHEDRNRLLRSLGGDDSPRPTILQTPVMLEERDSILLCTDGFWEYVTEEEILKDLSTAKDARDWLRPAASRLEARPAGDYDNYSAVAVIAAVVH